jgi:hypothetical protein
VTRRRGEILHRALLWRFPNPHRNIGECDPRHTAAENSRCIQVNAEDRITGVFPRDALR